MPSNINATTKTDQVVEILSYTFVQYAFIAGVCMSVLAGLLGPFVVSSRQSVTSEMLAHVALAGVGLALVFDMLPLVGAFAVLMMSAVLLWWIVSKEWYATDAISMLFLSGGLALALAFIHIARDRTISFETYLFGSILTVTGWELFAIIILTVAVAAIIFIFWHPLLGVVQSPAYKIPYSRRSHFLQLLFFMLLALTVWVGIKTVGGLLVGALLVIPVLTVRRYASSFRALVILSTIVSMAGVLGGLIFSLYVDVPSTSAIILALILFFILAHL